MFIQRWSTFSLFCVFAFAIAAGFFCGNRFYRTSQTIVIREKPLQGKSATLAQKVFSTGEITAIENPDDRCLALFAQLPTPARDDELIAAIEKLAEKNPLRAIELARAEKNSRLCERLLDAAFRGWGKTDATAAADWILSQPENDFDHNTAIASIFKGAVENPDAALQLAKQLL